MIFTCITNKKGGETTSISAFPAWGRGPRQRRSGPFASNTNAPLFLLYYLLSFIPCLPYPFPRIVIPSAALDLYCTAAIGKHAPSLKRHLDASFFAFPSPTVYRSERSLHFGPHDTQERRIVSYHFSYRCVELCLFEALYPAPLARPFSKGLLISLL